MYIVKTAKGHTRKFISREDTIDAVRLEVTGCLKGMYRAANIDSFAVKIVDTAKLSVGKEITETCYGTSFGKGINPGGCLTATITCTFVED